MTTRQDGMTVTEDDAREVRTVWELAQLAGCHSPDTTTSPGAVWLRQVADDVAGRMDYWTTPRPNVHDEAHELADNAVPIYTHERWLVFVDLCAYQEDTSEMSDSSDDLTTLAGVALYLIAERLVLALVSEADPQV